MSAQSPSCTGCQHWISRQDMLAAFRNARLAAWTPSAASSCASQSAPLNPRHAAGTLPEDCPEHPLLRQFVRLLPNPAADFSEVLYVFQRHGFLEDWQVRPMTDPHRHCCQHFAVHYQRRPGAQL